MVLNATEKALKGGGSLLEAGEHTAIRDAMAALQHAVQEDDPNEVRARIKRLDETTVHLAGLLLGQTIKDVATDEQTSSKSPVKGRR